MVSPLAMRDRYGFDAFRYYLLREMAFGTDAEFSEESLVARINADLANNLGNLASRTLDMTTRFAGGRVPEPGPRGPREQAVAGAAAAAAEKVDVHLRRCEFHRALEAVTGFADAVNRYLEERAPWKLAKQKPAGWETELATTLYTACEAVRVMALLLAPFLPDTAPVLLARLGLADGLADAKLPDDAARFGALAPGTAVTKGAPLFPRVEAGGAA
jgi:methionyl-tRNA synthetase